MAAGELIMARADWILGVDPRVSQRTLVIQGTLPHSATYLEHPDLASQPRALCIPTLGFLHPNLEHPASQLRASCIPTSSVLHPNLDPPSPTLNSVLAHDPT